LLSFPKWLCPLTLLSLFWVGDLSDREGAGSRVLMVQAELPKRSRAV
jgi:hypothetical protein